MVDVGRKITPRFCWRKCLSLRAENAVEEARARSCAVRDLEKGGGSPFALPPFSLFLLNAANQAAQLNGAAQAAAGSFWLADFKLPERNLELPGSWLTRLCLWYCGKSVVTAYRNFMRRGGLEEALRGAGLEVRHRELFYFGVAAAVLVAVPGRGA